MKFIVCLLLISVYVAQAHAMFDYGASIQAQAHDNINRAQQQIQETIRSQRERSEAMQREIENEAKASGTYSSFSSSSSSDQPGTYFHTSSSNNPRSSSTQEHHGSSSSSSSSSSTVNGVQTTIQTEVDGEGNTITIETIQETVNGQIQRTVKYFNSGTDTLTVTRFIICDGEATQVDSFDQ